MIAHSVDPSTLEISTPAGLSPFEVYISICREKKVRLEITNQDVADTMQPIKRIRVGVLPTLSGAGTFCLGEPIYVSSGQSRNKEYILLGLATAGLIMLAQNVNTYLSFEPGLPAKQEETTQ